MSSDLFAIKGSVGAELRRFKSFAASEPEKSKRIYADGEKLIILASKGEHAQFKRFASSLNRDDILAYFSAKALMASLIGGHLMLSTFILDNGYPMKADTGLPNILHDCLRELSDYECVGIVKLFVMKGVDINTQEPKTWYSPLHIAVSRSLLDTVDELIASGADVNIVGADDVMPLVLAQNLDDSIPEKHRIIETLEQRGARLTWRRQNTIQSDASGGSRFDTSFTSNSEIRAGPSTSITTLPLNTPFTLSNPLPPPASNTNRVHFNGAQLTAPQSVVPAAGTTSATHVRFNGASMQLEPVVLSVPPKALVNPHSMPLPRVTVSTSSGARLQPPPRVPTTDSGAGLVAEAAVSESFEQLSIEESTETEEEYKEGHEMHHQHSSVQESLEQATESRKQVAAEMLIGSVQLSEDGAAMLFSTG